MIDLKAYDNVKEYAARSGTSCSETSANGRVF